MQLQNSKQVEKDLKKLFKKYGIEKKITVEKIKKWIWDADGPAMEAVNKYNKKCFQLFPEIEDIDELNNVMQVFVSAWNTFPHKELDGKSPEQMMQGLAEEEPKNKKNQGNMPRVRVGDNEMSFEEFEAMLKEMEKAQKPFKRWIEKDALPKYEKYLEQMMRNPRTRENHYDVAEIFFQRVLHVGFVDLESIRPEFAWKEFPLWWSTHVLCSKLTPAKVRKSLEELFKFIDVVYS